MIKRLVLLSLLLLGLLQITAAPAAAITYKYGIPVTVTENGTTAYGPISLIADISNSDLQALSFVNSSANNTDFSTGEHLPTNNTTVFYVPSIPISSTSIYYYYLGSDTELATFPIMLGLDGYVTVVDNTTIELGDNYTLGIQGGFDLTQVGTNFTNKVDAYRWWIPSANDLSYTMYGTSIIQANSDDGLGSIYAGANTRDGERINSFPVGSISKASFKLQKTGSPTGTANITVRQVSDDALLGILGTIDVSTLTGALVWYDFDTTPVANPTIQDIRVSIEYIGGNATSCPQISIDTTSPPYAGGVRSYYNAGWTDNAAQDTNFKLYRADITVTATGLGSMDTAIVDCTPTTLTLIVDGVIEDSTSTNGTSVIDNANSIVWMQGRGVVYTDNISMSIDGVRQLYYAPQSLLTSTTLPDSENTTNNDGTITWGTNPTSVSVVVGSASVLTSNTASNIAAAGSTLLPIYNPSAGMLNETGTGNQSILYPYLMWVNTTTSIDMTVLWYIAAIVIAMFSGLIVCVSLLVVTRGTLPMPFVFGAMIIVIDLVLGVFTYSLEVIDHMVLIVGTITSIGLFLAMQQLTLGGRGSYG